MKNLLKAILLGIVLFTVSVRVSAQDPITLIIKEGITKVIKAVDLKIQRLQNNTIWLQNAQKSIENTMSKLRLDEITDWIERQRVLYKDYFDELWKVKTFITYYHRVKEIFNQQVALVAEYKRAYTTIKQDDHFTPDEILYMGKVYTGIIEESLKNIESISLVINSFATQMSDAKRLEIINKTAERIQENYSDLRMFTAQNARLSLQRARDAEDIAIVKALYGLQ